VPAWLQVAGQNITRNVFYNTGDAGIFFHCGNDHVATNNIVAFPARQPNGNAIRSW
jgi:hypothetical protein